LFSAADEEDELQVAVLEPNDPGPSSDYFGQVRERPKLIERVDEFVPA